jgi:hypothetical protein
MGEELLANSGCPNSDPAVTIVPAITLARFDLCAFDLVMDFMVLSS